MTIDQRGSSTDMDRVPAILAELRGLTAARFERSVGDEVQGVVPDAADVVEIALHALRSGRWYVGIGIGAVDTPPAASPREGSGAAFVAARQAVDQAKAAAGHVPVSVVSGAVLRGAVASPQAAEGATACANAEAVLRLIGRLVQDRTKAQWTVVDMIRTVQQGRAGRHGTQKQAARELGITEQSVSRAVRRSGWQEEWAARPAAGMLLATAHKLVVSPGEPDTRNQGDR